MTDFTILKGTENMHPEEVKKLLEQTYWAKDRSLDKIQKSMEHSVCFGVFDNISNRQVGFARVVTDYTTAHYICDVIIDSGYRGHGLGKRLLSTIENDESFCKSRGFLFTKDAHGLYGKYGFIPADDKFMTKNPTI